MKKAGKNITMIVPGRELPMSEGYRLAVRTWNSEIEGLIDRVQVFKGNSKTTYISIQIHRARVGELKQAIAAYEKALGGGNV